MTQYSRGRDFEWKVRDDLKEKGYHVIRSAGSKTKVDLVASGNRTVYFIQCKLETISGKEKGELYRISTEAGAEPVIASRTKDGRRYAITYGRVNCLGEVTPWLIPSLPTQGPSKT